MRRVTARLALGLAAIFLGWPAVSVATAAETAPTSPVPEEMPFDIPYGPSIDLAKAKQLLAAAEAEASKHNWKMAIAVVDPHGELVALEKMDETQFASVTIAQGKARTAVRFRRPTAVFSDLMEKGHPNVPTLDPGLVASAGGFPLMADGKIIGAIGCSGGTPGQDSVVCKAALDSVR